MAELNMDKEIEYIVTLALREDVGEGDITTSAIYSGKEAIEAEFIAKQNGVVAGLEVVRYIFGQLDSSIEFDTELTDGDMIKRGQMIASAKGPANVILTGERTALNFLQRMSGIASRTRYFVDLVDGTAATILDTRKTAPGHRLLDKMAVRLGGGENHRMGLYDRYLIKENHINVAGNITEAINRCARQRQNMSEKPLIEVEVKDLKEVEEAANHPESDILLLDNMSLTDMADAVSKYRGGKKLEASGNVSHETVRSIAETGVDYISIGELTHSVRALDISLLFVE